MKKILPLLRLLFELRYAHFFITGVSGILLNMLVTWSLTEFVFGLDRYFYAYLIGAVTNLSYNFLVHTFVTFGTTKRHIRRFVLFVLYSLLNASVQIVIVRSAVNTVGAEYYLPVIAGTILVLSTISFIVFKYLLFDERKKQTHA